MEKQIRFAPLIRVSTEGQDKRGESLRTQTKKIIQYVKSLDGVIPKSCWQYSGQEHATPGYEREKLEQLLEDSGKDIFDAIIVDDASRWSRDNEKSKAGLRTFKKNNTRFFVGTSEFDLFLPQAMLFLGMSTEMNEFFALEQARKSMLNRIERAKRGVPTSGKLPYGRIYDKEKNEWSIDAEKAKNIAWAAGQYLKGKSMQKLADTLGVNMTNLWKILTKRSGDMWEVRFRSPRLNIKETVPITVPRLLPHETIDRIHERAASNKTYTHGCIKHQYLLSRTVFCSHCGYAMFGQTNHNNRRYYRHPRHRTKECDVGFWVRAGDLEDAIMTHLFGMYGDINNMEKAMLRAIPENSKIEELRGQKTILEKQLENAEGDRQRLIRSIAKGIVSDTEAEKTIQEIRERETLLKAEIDKILPHIVDVPTKKHIKQRAKLIKRTLEAVFFRPERLKKMSFEDKRKIVQMAFGGKDADGNRCGVYVHKPDKAGRPVTYEIKGVFADIQQGQLPMTLKDTQEILGLKKEYVGDYNPLKDKSTVKQDCFSKRHAHHGVRFYQRR